LENALTNSPTDMTLLLSIGAVLLDMGEHDRAEEFFQKAILVE
jgi:hypothetical protein